MVKFRQMAINAANTSFKVFLRALNPVRWPIQGDFRSVFTDSGFNRFIGLGGFYKL
jgi:hypothetical protein